MVELYAFLVKLGLVDGFLAAAWGWISGHCGVVPFASICPKPSGHRSQFHLPKTNWQIDPIFVDSGDYQSKIIEGPEMQNRFFPHFTFGNIQGARWVCPIQNRVEPKPGLDPVDLHVASPGD